MLVPPCKGTWSAGFLRCLSPGDLSFGLDCGSIIDGRFFVLLLGKYINWVDSLGGNGSIWGESCRRGSKVRLDA